MRSTRLSNDNRGMLVDVIVAMKHKHTGVTIQTSDNAMPLPHSIYPWYFHVNLRFHLLHFKKIFVLLSTPLDDDDNNISCVGIDGCFLENEDINDV